MSETTSLDVLFFARFYLDTGPLDVSGPPVNAYPVSLTANASTDVLTLSAGSLINATRVRFYSSGTLPGGLALATDYWVIESSGATFQVSTEKDGSAVNITSTGSGTISARIAFEGRVISWGNIERSCAMPAGLFETGEATLELADTDGAIRAAFDAATPLRRIGEIYIESRTHATTVDEPDLNRPIYRGSIANAEFTPGHASITLRDAAAAWLSLPIPALINRRNFTNLPDGHFEGFAPIIFGRLESYSATNVTPQGRIACQHVNTATNSYLVARHPCHARIAVYRKRSIDDYFSVVDPSEYSITTPSVTDSGITYTLTLITFTARQDDGTEIRADFSGVSERPAISDGLPEVTGELRNPVDAIINLCLLGDDDDDAYDNQSFLDVRIQCAGYGFYCDGAIDGPTTIGAAIADICSNFGIHFFQNQFGLIALRLDPGIAFTVNTSTDVCTITGGSFADDTQISVANVGGALPSPLDEIFDYFVRDSSGLNFKLALSIGGSAVNITSAGSGTHYIGPKTQVPNEITKDDTLFRTVNAKLNQQPANRFRYRYCRNWGLSGIGLDLLSSATHQRTWLQGEWGWEDVVDQTNDRAELGDSGAPSLAEEIVKLRWISDPDQALRVVEDRAGYLALRSYRVEFELAAPEWFRNIGIATPIYLTHVDGIGDGGFDGAFFKVEGVSIDLGTCRMKVSAVRQFLRSELTFSATWDPETGHPAHGANVRSPQILVNVEDSDTPGDVEPATIKPVVLSYSLIPPEGYMNAIPYQSEADGVRSLGFAIPEGAGLWGLNEDLSIENLNAGPVVVVPNADANARLIVEAPTGRDAYVELWQKTGRKSRVVAYDYEDESEVWSLGGFGTSDRPFELRMGSTPVFRTDASGEMYFPTVGSGTPSNVLVIDSVGKLIKEAVLDFAMATDLDALSSTVSSLSSSVDSLSATVSGLDSTVSGLSSTVGSLSSTVSGLSSTVSGLSSSVSAIAAWLGAPYGDFASLQEWGDANYGAAGNWTADGEGGIYNANNNYVRVQNPTGQSSLYVDAPDSEAGSSIFLRSGSGANTLWSYTGETPLWRIGYNDSTHWMLEFQGVLAINVDNAGLVDIPNELSVGGGVYSSGGYAVPAGVGISSNGTGTEAGIVFDPDVVLYGTGHTHGPNQIGYFSGDYDALSEDDTALVVASIQSGALTMVRFALAWNGTIGNYVTWY